MKGSTGWVLAAFMCMGFAFMTSVETNRMGMCVMAQVSFAAAAILRRLEAKS